MRRAIHYKTPSLFRFIFLPARLVHWLTHVLRPDQWIITGEEIANKQQLAIIYTGSKERKNYLIQLAFGSSYRENYVGKTWLMVTEVPKVFRILFERKKCFYIPCWISGEVDISVDIYSFTKNRSLKSDMCRIRKNKLQFELTNDLPQFHNFYYNMYLPYITRAHGSRAVIMKYAYMEKEFRNCTLLLIKKEKAYIAGILLVYGKNSVRLWTLGVRDGSFDYVKDGAIGALFYFAVHYLQEKGYERVHFGLSRAFLKDGVLKYKNKWNQKIIGTAGMGFLMKPLLRTTGVKGFLLNNPFLFMDKKRLNGAIFVEIDEPLSEKDFGKIYKDYSLTGMNKLYVYRFGDGNSKVQENVPPEFFNRITVCSAESLF